MRDDPEATIDAVLQRIGEQVLAKNKKSPKRVIFDLGTSFHEAAKRCSEPQVTGPGQIMTPTCPMITCFAFASELYLKSLVNAPAPRGHDLWKLIEKLETQDRNGILLKYEEMTGRDKAAFRRDVKELCNAFVDWRYIFERGTTKLSVRRLATLTLAIYRHARAAHPDWDVRPHLHRSIERPLSQDILSQISMGGGVMLRAVAKKDAPREQPVTK